MYPLLQDTKQICTLYLPGHLVPTLNDKILITFPGTFNQTQNKRTTIQPQPGGAHPSRLTDFKPSNLKKEIKLDVFDTLSEISIYVFPVTGCKEERGDLAIGRRDRVPKIEKTCSPWSDSRLNWKSFCSLVRSNELKPENETNRNWVADRICSLWKWFSPLPFCFLPNFIACP